MSRPSGLVPFRRYGHEAAPLLPRSLSTTHQKRHKDKLHASRGRAERRASRRAEFEARQLIVREHISKAKRKAKE